MTSGATPQVEQRATPPPGSVPRNRQTWMMLAVAAVIVLAVVVSGSTAPGRPAAAAQSSAPPANSASRAEIERYTQTLREEEQRLRSAQAAARQSQEAFRQVTSANGMQGSIPGQGLPVPGNPSPVYAPAMTASAPVVPQKSAVEEDREKREYASVFASNIALSYRRPLKEPVDEQPKETTADAPETKHAERPKPEQVRPPSGRPEHTLREGTIIEAVLTNRLEGAFSGAVNCQVTTDVYSHNRQHLLIPKGSRVLGEAKRVQDQDQQRLAIVFHRLIQPDGYAVSLDDMPGMDQAGATGVKDKVNHHYLSTFGTSVALGLLAGFSMAGTSGWYSGGGKDMYRQGIASQLARDSTRILDRKLNRLPDITIREGTRIRILLAGDLSLPAYPPLPGL